MLQHCYSLKSCGLAGFYLLLRLLTLYAMNRRDFCKFAAGTALLAALMPSRMLAAVPSRQRCVVSVLRCGCHPDLQARFASDPDAGPCPMLSAGMSWIVGSGRMPEGMCPKAWKAISSHLTGDMDSCSGSRSVIVSCPDGIRPVIFKIDYIN